MTTTAATSSTSTNTTTTMASSFKLPLFTPTQPDIWVKLVEDAFRIHKITNNGRKMLEIRMALTQEVRALTAHLTDGDTVADYAKLTAFLRNYGSRSDVQKLRAMVAKRPIGDKTPIEHLYALRLEFGTKPETLPNLRRIFEDSLAPHIAALLATERIDDIDTYADRASELYVLYEPSSTTAVASVACTEVTFTNNELMQTLKTLTTQMAALSTEINLIKSSSPSYSSPSYSSPPNSSPSASLERQPRGQSYYQPQSISYRHPGPKPLWPTSTFNNGQTTRPPTRQQDWRSQPRQQQQQRQPPMDFSATLNSNGLCPYHEHFGSQARNCKPGCIYEHMRGSINTLEESEN